MRVKRDRHETNAYIEEVRDAHIKTINDGLTLANQHPLTRSIQKSFDSQSGKLPRWPYRYRNKAFDICVSHKSLIRVIRIINGFIWPMIHRGHRLKNDGSLEVFGELVTLHLREKVEGHKSSHNYTGVLAFQITHWPYPLELVDTDMVPLEEKLANVIGHTELVVIRKKLERCDYAKSKIEEQEAKEVVLLEKRRQAIEQQLIKDEEAKFHELLDMARRFDDAQTIRRFLTHFEACAKPKVISRHKEWLRWAWKKVEEADPILSFEYPDDDNDNCS